MRLVIASLVVIGCTHEEEPPAPAFELLGPDVTLGGMDLDHAGADWARWALEQPVPHNPVLDETGADCAEGQTDGVFYLAGTFGDAPVSRACTATSAGPFLMPLYNLFYDNCGTPTEDQVSDEVLRSTVDDLLDEIDHLQLTVDGEDVFSSVADAEAWRTRVTAYSWENPETDGLYDSWGYPFTGTCDPSYAAGYYAPLRFEPGEHALSLVAGTPDFEVTVDYALTVP